MSLIYKEESFAIIGACFDVYNFLGYGFLEIVYKDALEIEFAEREIGYKREVKYNVNYKGTNLPHNFYADFVIFNSIILEVKALKEISDVHIAQCLNYLKVSGLRLALLVNFGREGVDYKRLVL